MSNDLLTLLTVLLAGPVRTLLHSPGTRYLGLSSNQLTGSILNSISSLTVLAYVSL